jgi:hypothetical protein
LRSRLIGAPAAAAGDGHDLGRGHGGAAGAFAGDQRPHLRPRIWCGGGVWVRNGGVVLERGGHDRGWDAAAGEATTVTRTLTIIFPTVITLWLIQMGILAFRKAPSVEGAIAGEL